MTLLLRIWLIFLPATALGAGDATPVSDIEIWSTLINHGLGADVPVVVIAERTSGDPAALAGSDDTPSVIEELGAPAETLGNWLQRNEQTYTIDDPLNLRASYQLLDSEGRASLFKDVEPAAGWANFFTRYPGAPGLLRVSRAGFDATLTHAVVYVEFQCGAECGSGRLIYLRQTDERQWEVKNSALVWLTD